MPPINESLYRAYAASKAMTERMFIAIVLVFFVNWLGAMIALSL